MGVFEIIGSLFLVVGCLLALTGSVGVLRMPDFYSRLHPAGKTDTFAQALVLVGLALFATQGLLNSIGEAEGHGKGELVTAADTIVKLILLSALLFLTAPTSTHAISKAARLDKRIAWTPEQDEARVAEIEVPGDVDEALEEPPCEVLDVPPARGRPRPAPTTEPEEPAP